MGLIVSVLVKVKRKSVSKMAHGLNVLLKSSLKNIITVRGNLKSVWFSLVTWRRCFCRGLDKLWCQIQ